MSSQEVYSSRSSLYVGLLSDYDQFMHPAFSDIIGHDRAKQLLSHGISHPKNGYLIIGPEGIGRRMLAEAFVRSLVGLTPDRALTSHPDVVLLERELSESGKHLKKEVTVQAVRELRKRLIVRPSIAERMVAYIGEADRLSDEGVNALLKLIEEPPAGAVFVFVASQRSRIPLTLLSRVVLIQLESLSPEEMQEWMNGAHITESDQSKMLQLFAGRPGYVKRYVEDVDWRAFAMNANASLSMLLSARSFADALAAMKEIADSCDASHDPVAEWRKTLHLWQIALRQSLHTHTDRAHAIGRAVCKAIEHINGSISPRIHLELALLGIFSPRVPSCASVYVNEFLTTDQFTNL